MAAPTPARCSFYVEKKKRFCKMIVGTGRKFCGEHGNMEEGGSRRIVCPLDPKHTVSRDKLEQHLKKCNSRAKPKPVYYVQDVNAGSADGAPPPHQVSLSERSRSELQDLLEKLQAAVTDLQCETDDSVMSHPVLQEELNNPKNGDAAFKHLKQQSSILGHLEALQLLGGGRCFVEFGAGRGKLSHWIHGALGAHRDLHFLLVERSSTRFKVDGKHQEDGVQFERLQVDIQHLDLSKQNSLPLVGVGKHLCGAATDLSLRCLLERSGSEVALKAEPPCKRFKPSEPTADLGLAADRSERPVPVPGPGCEALEVLGLAVALCCHHRCEWRHYVGKEFFLQRGLGAAEFAAFCRMSSWATCGLRPANQDGSTSDGTNQKGEEEEHEPAEETDTFTGSLSAEQRERVGRLCKLMIDSGRVDFLRRKGFQGRLRRYASTRVTLENVLLTAVPSDPCTPKL
ncbi:tRNA:m(4)X modification enzyme TRM13 homolog isoform X2 [Genypterus blacodes]|uniref:tRNA:m(4)X modification enzyme TRM13 homolog isoform X2 n=1 Tax=Genypterus blacodes TaxID=154954 RepID=UPI003F75DC96